MVEITNFYCLISVVHGSFKRIWLVSGINFLICGRAAKLALAIHRNRCAAPV